MKIPHAIISGAVCLLLVFGMVAASQAAGSDLVSRLVKSLGVSAQQASGGAGAIFRQASSRMNAEDFSRIKAAVPDVDSLMKKAPEVGAGTGGLSGMAASVMGKASSDTAGKIGDAAGLVQSFKSLGMDSEMVGQFTTVVLDYAGEKGGSTVMNLLKGALM